ncbi:uncharacterized protein TNCV_2005351 [Trichonephila clavipes]|nr:uncharacterized protein TNCV_2005351 [Trichonephila clavipes]
MIVSKLKANGLEIMNCRGQAYDNTATMAGCHTEGLNIHQCAQKIRALQTVLEAKQDEFMDDALMYAKSLCEELEISFEPPRRFRRKHIFGDGSKDVQLSYEDDLGEQCFLQ